MRQAKTRSALFLSLTILSLFLFGWRAVLRSGEARDSLVLYLSAKALIQGKNPYSRESLDENWRATAKGQSLTSYTPLVYPPTSIFLFAPLAELPWLRVRQGLLLINVMSLLLTLVILGRQLAGNVWHQWALWIIGLSWGPWHTGISTANMALLVTALGTLAWGLADSKGWKWSSLALLFALLLKPQIGLLFWFYFCLRKQWRIALASSSAALLMLILSFCWLQYQSPGWFEAWRETLAIAVAPGHENDPTVANHLRNDLLNLQRLLSLFSENASVINGFILAAGIAFVLYLWRRHQQVELPPPALLTISLVTASGLLPVYHRYYDASLLLLAVTWALKFLDGIFSCAARTVFLCSLIFLVPGAAWLAWLMRRGALPTSLINHWWWETLVMPHQVWALTVIVLLLSYALHVSGKKRAVLLCG
jgi:hypothetical protein